MKFSMLQKTDLPHHPLSSFGKDILFDGDVERGQFFLDKSARAAFNEELVALGCFLSCFFNCMSIHNSFFVARIADAERIAF